MRPARVPARRDDGACRSTTGHGGCGSGCSRVPRCAARRPSGWSRPKSVSARRAQVTRGLPMRAAWVRSNRPGSRTPLGTSRERATRSRIGTRSAARRWCGSVSRCTASLWSRVVRARPERSTPPRPARCSSSRPWSGATASRQASGSRRHSSTGTRPWGAAWSKARRGPGAPASSRAKRHARHSTRHACPRTSTRSMPGNGSSLVSTMLCENGSSWTRKTSSRARHRRSATTTSRRTWTWRGNAPRWRTSSLPASPTTALASASTSSC